MATYVAVPLKKTWEVDFVKPLRTFIANTFADAKSEDYNSALTEFNKLRCQMMTKSGDKHESALEVLYRYYDQLIAIEGKFPIAENQIRINFKWQDAFDKESFWSGKRTLTVSAASYEKVCLLFNVAALQSQIAEAQNHESDEGLKTSAKLFQQSAGIFSYLKDCVLSHIPQADPTPDLHPDSLAALSALMLAQAQDCFCKKAINDNMKDAIIAKLSNQCSDHYAEALKLLQLPSIRDLWPKEWIPMVGGNQAGFHGLAEFSQSKLSGAKKDFGEEIARLQHAEQLLNAAELRGGDTFRFTEDLNKVRRALQSAKKDNDFIYHAKIPEQKSLSAIGKASLAKPLPLASPMSAKFQDCFGKIVPIAVHQALMGFENSKAAIVNAEVGRLREQTQLLNGILSSLNLPAAIEDLSGTKVPQSVLEKSAKVRELGGIATLGQLMSGLPELLSRNREVLDEGYKMLNDEESSDKQLREQFKERWSRTPSETLTEPIKTEGAKYRSIIDNAVHADDIVQQKFKTHKQGIEMLSKSDAEIERSLPSASPVAALKDSACVKELRQLMEQVETIKAERDVMEKEIKEANFDISSKFMSALTQDGALNEEAISAIELDKIYGPLREQVSASCHKQEALLADIQRANSEFTQAKASNQTGASREQILKDLAAAFDGFIELKNNLEEGTKFYNDLTHLLLKFQNKVSDFCFARKTEKDDLMKELQSSIARQPTQAPPPAPTYQQQQQQNTNEARRPPPARPPPPTRPPAPASASGPPAPAAAAPQPPPGQPPAYGQQQPFPGYGGAPLPYPMYPQQGYAPMPMGYNPYAQYVPPPQGYPQPGQASAPPYPQQQQYPGYPQYPQQQWR